MTQSRRLWAWLILAAAMLLHPLFESLHLLHESSETEDESFLPKEVASPSVDPANTTFCVSWDVNSDNWWTHNPDWFVSYENDTHYCFSRMPPEKAAFFRELYDIQFRSNCSTLETRKLRSHGWGSDLRFVMDGLHHAYLQKRPVQVWARKWHYAGIRPALAVCKTRDLNCYFLPMSNCPPNRQKVIDTKVPTIWGYAKTPQRHYMEYITRPQTWLRRAVYNYTTLASIDIQTPCAVLHVRRSDVVLHSQISRRYRPVADYIHALANVSNTSNLFLVTDDHNAIGEALTQFPDKHWMYLKRKRHRGAEGGFENQFPSGDPKQEVIILMAIFSLVRHCDVIVHGSGHFSTYLHGQMAIAKQDAISVDMDQGDKNGDIYSPSNKKTVNVSINYDALLLSTQEKQVSS